MKIFFVAIAIFLPSLVFAENWKIKNEIDSMNDKQYLHAIVLASTGETFTLLQKDDSSIWAYFELAGTNQFSVQERLTIRVDKNEPIEYNQDFQDLSRELGNPIHIWEWNPNLIGFEVGSKGHCHKLLEQVYSGSKLVIRYHPNQSTKRDVSFSISGGKNFISKATGLECKSK